MIAIGKREYRLRDLAVRFAINAAALFVADALVGGIQISGWPAYAMMAALIGLVNAFAKPVLQILTCPLILLTLGLFLLVVNAAVFGIAAWLSGQLGADVHVDGFWAALAGALIVSIVSWIISMALE